MMNVPFYKPSLGEEEANAVYEQVKSGWLTFGPKVEEFEQKFAEYIGAPYCVMLDNCTAALTLACEYVFQDVPRKNRSKFFVTVPSLTCAATALAPIHAGLDIKFGDLKDDDSFCLEEIKTWSIPVSFAGKYAEEPFTVVEDLAHRITRNCFNGNLQAFSFYVTKCMTTGEGGMIACKTLDQAEWFRKARLYGNGNAIYKREKMYETGDSYWWFESEFEGWKANPTDVMATIGLVQLSKLDKMNEDRSRIAQMYNTAFGLTVDRSPWHLYPILINNRDKFMYYMKENGVKCSVHFPPLHMMKAFQKYNIRELPVTEKIYSKIVSLPLFPSMSDIEVNYVIDLVLKWQKANP